MIRINYYLQIASIYKENRTILHHISGFTSINSGTANCIDCMQIKNTQLGMLVVNNIIFI